MDETDSRDWSDPPPGRPRRLLLWTAAGLVALFIAAYFASPLLAIGSLKLAAKRGDRPRLEQLVDFPALRASLKAQLTVLLSARHGRDNGIAAAVLLSDSFLDAVLTPSNLAALINGATFGSKPEPAPFEASAALGPPSAGPAPAVQDPSSLVAPAPPAPPTPVSAEIHGRYVGLDRFEVSVARFADPGPTVFAFRRRGLFGWRLTDIRIPPAALARIG